jgi:predicted nuclease of restriction endonuclease-like (RecB) superfamily
MPKLTAKSYNPFFKGIAGLLETSRQQAARAVNAILTATYWEIGRRIVEFEQKGEERAAYGEELLKKLSVDLTARFGRGFSRQNLQLMRQFYLAYPQVLKGRTVSGIFQEIRQTPSGKSMAVDKTETTLQILSSKLPLSWSHYVLLIMRGRSPESRDFYETEALRGGWSVRQLERQINSQFYERTVLSKNKVAMLKNGSRSEPSDFVSPEEAIKDPYVLEFLGLKDEYSESDLEEALISHLEAFLLELGDDFAFVARQKRLRIGNEWFRVDLVFFHRSLRCIVLIDLKIGKFTHADAGQMHLYLNYAREYWMRKEENPPVGLILCAYKDKAVAKYSLEGLPNKILATEYKTALPDERFLADELKKTQKILAERHELKK